MSHSNATSFSTGLLLCLVFQAALLVGFETDVSACTEAQPGIRVHPSVEDLTRVPSDGVFPFSVAVVGMEMDEAESRIKVRVSDADGNPVTGTLEWLPLDQNWGRQELERHGTVFGPGYHALFSFRPDSPFAVDATYTAKIDVANDHIPSESYTTQFSPAQSDAGETIEWGYAEIDSIRPVERASGTRKCCRKEIDSCNQNTDCWRETRTNHAQLDLRLHAESPLTSQLVHIFYDDSHETPTASYVATGPNTSGMRYEIAEITEEYCVQHDLYNVASGEVSPQPTLCITPDDPDVYGQVSAEVDPPDSCIDEPYVDSDGDRMPDDGGDDLPAGEGEDGDQADNAGVGFGHEGCGCAAGGQTPSATRFSVVLLVLSLMVARGRRWMRRAGR